MFQSLKNKYILSNQGTPSFCIPPTKKGLPRWLSDKTIHLTMQETQEMWVRSLSQADPLEEEMATHSSILA